MKHPVRDRIVIMLCALRALGGAAAAAGLCAGRLSLAPIIAMLESASVLSVKSRAILIVAAVVLVLIALLLISIVLPGKRRRSSSFAIQKNENGTVRISLKALDALVQKCLNQHAELKVVTSSLFSDEESILVDVHITLQSDISMPLAISALQKQIKKYLEACSGVMVKEVRVFVDNTIPATEDTVRSPYAIPASLLGIEITEALPSAEPETPVEVGEQPLEAVPPTQEEAPQKPVQEPEAHGEPEAAPIEPESEPDGVEQSEDREDHIEEEETGEWA